MDEGRELALVLERLTQLVRRLATAGDLSMSALALLARLERDGPQRLTDLATGEAVSQPGMTQLVGRLERDGWVVRTVSGTDRRSVLVQATDAGCELVLRRRSQRAEALHHLLRRLDPGDRAAIERAVPALTRLIDESSPHPLEPAP